MTTARHIRAVNPTALPLLRSCLSWGVIVAGCALVALGLVTSQREPPEALLVTALLAAVARKFDLDLETDRKASLVFVPILVGAILFGLAGVTAACLGATLIPDGRARSPLREAAYQIGALMIAGTTSLVILRTLGGTGAAEAGPALIVPVAIAALANFSINTALAAAVTGTDDQGRLRTAWSGEFLWMLPHYLALGLLSLVLVAAYAALGLCGIAMFLVPPAMLQLSLKRYVDRTVNSVAGLRVARRNLSDRPADEADLERANADLSLTVACLRDAYGATVRSLIAALDARDRDTRGHSERVAELALEIAVEMGIPRESRPATLSGDRSFTTSAR